jgi:hypothetical protein
LLDPAVAFTSISLFGILELPVRLVGLLLQSYSNALVSLDRIQEFVELENTHLREVIIKIVFIMLE